MIFPFLNTCCVSNIRCNVVTSLTLHCLTSRSISKEGKVDTVWRLSHSVEIITQCEDHHKIWISSQSVEIITVWSSSHSVEIIKKRDHHTVWSSSNSVEIITHCGHHHTFWSSSQSVEIITKCGDHHTFHIAYRQSPELTLTIYGRYNENGHCSLSLPTREHQRWWVFEERVQRVVLGSERKEVT